MQRGPLYCRVLAEEMIEEIGTAAMGVALLAAFAVILGAFALILWGRLRGRMRGDGRA